MGESDVYATLDAYPQSAGVSSPWDQRNASEGAWKALLEGAASGTFVVRSSSMAGSTRAAGEVVATITMVQQGGDGLINQQVIRASISSSNSSSEGNSCQLKGSNHVHASLAALVAFYKDPMYFALAEKPDVPVALVDPPQAPASAALYETRWWQQSYGSTRTRTAGAHSQSIYVDIYNKTNGGTLVQQQYFERLVGGNDISHYEVILKAYNPIVHMEKTKTPLLSLTEAVKILAAHCNGDMVGESQKALAYGATHAHKGIAQRPGAAAPMGVDDIASVYMYTMETDFYGRMNQELGGYGRDEIHGAVEHFLPITKLLMTALAKLPPMPAGTKLFRGVKLPYKVILGEDIKVRVDRWCGGGGGGSSAFGGSSASSHYDEVEQYMMA
eukprot:gene14525-23595_t